MNSISLNVYISLVLSSRVYAVIIEAFCCESSRYSNSNTNYSLARLYDN